MIKNFKKELDLVSTNNQISEKLMIFSLYNEFFNDIMGNLDDSFIQYYSSFMEKTFESVIAELNLQEDISVNAKQFMKIYFKMLKPNMPFARYTIMTFERKLNSLIDASGYVNVIEKFDSIPLDTQINIMAHFREYINSMYHTTIELCGEENSRELRHNILEMLSVKLEEYLKDSLNKGIDSVNLIDNLKNTLSVYTKDYLMNKLKNEEFGLKVFQDETVKHFFASFNEIEQKIWLIGLIYVIAGYDKNDKSKEKEKLREICKLLKISKLKYIRTAFSMALHLLKTMKTEDFCANFPKKIK